MARHDPTDCPPYCVFCREQALRDALNEALRRGREEDDAHDDAMTARIAPARRPTRPPPVPLPPYPPMIVDPPPRSRRMGETLRTWPSAVILVLWLLVCLVCYKACHR